MAKLEYLIPPQEFGVVSPPEKWFKITILCILHLENSVSEIKLVFHQQLKLDVLIF